MNSFTLKWNAKIFENCNLIAFRGREYDSRSTLLKSKTQHIGAIAALTVFVYSSRLTMKTAMALCWDVSAAPQYHHHCFQLREDSQLCSLAIEAFLELGFWPSLKYSLRLARNNLYFPLQFWFKHFAFSLLIWLSIVTAHLQLMKEKLISIRLSSNSEPMTLFTVTIAFFFPLVTAFVSAFTTCPLHANSPLCPLKTDHLSILPAFLAFTVILSFAMNIRFENLSHRLPPNNRTINFVGILKANVVRETDCFCALSPQMFQTRSLTSAMKASKEAVAVIWQALKELFPRHNIHTRIHNHWHVSTFKNHCLANLKKLS